MSLSERRAQASDLFLKGFSPSEVSRIIGVTWDTAKAYKTWHEERLGEAAAAQPQLLQDVLKNTVQTLAELDQVRAAAWRQYHTSPSRQIKLQALNTVRSSQADKAKLLGLLGVKQDVWAMVASVKFVQDRLIDFMQRELCPEDRGKLEVFLMTPEVQQYMGTYRSTDIPLLEIEEGETEEQPV